MHSAPTVVETLDFLREFRDGKHPHQRLGQAFVNRFKAEDPEGTLFNTICPVKAQTLIWEASRID